MFFEKVLFVAFGTFVVYLLFVSAAGLFVR